MTIFVSLNSFNLYIFDNKFSQCWLWVDSDGLLPLLPHKENVCVGPAVALQCDRADLVVKREGGKTHLTAKYQS